MEDLVDCLQLSGNSSENDIACELMRIHYLLSQLHKPGSTLKDLSDIIMELLTMPEGPMLMQSL